MIRKWQTLVFLSWDDKLLLLQAFLLLPLVALLLQTWGMRRTQSILAWLSYHLISETSEAKFSQITKTTRIVQIAVRHSPYWTNCLRKSLVLWFLLRRQGIDSELRIGVRREQDKFEAHAWIEYEGRVLNDNQNVRQQFAMFEHPIEVKR